MRFHIRQFAGHSPTIASDDVSPATSIRQIDQFR